MLEPVDRGGDGSCLMSLMGPVGYFYNTQAPIIIIVTKHELHSTGPDPCEYKYCPIILIFNQCVCLQARAIMMELFSIPKEL